LSVVGVDAAYAPCSIEWSTPRNALSASAFVAKPPFVFWWRVPAAGS